MARSIALIGISGAGKSTVASLIAQRLGYRWLDADREIEARTGRLIPEIFVEDGEAAFRVIEAAVTSELLAAGDLVVATGGGLTTTPAGRQSLASAFVVWLRLSPDVAAKRLMANPETEKRPLLVGDALARLRTLAQSRAESYNLAANAIIDVDTMAPGDVADAVVDAVLSHSARPMEIETTP